MERLSAYTLVDITPSGVTGEADMNRPEYHQMQNLHMLLQVIGMRTQPMNHSVTVLDSQSMDKHRFGSRHKGVHRVWRLDFETDHDGVWDDGTGTFGALKGDLENVSIVSDLGNTADFSPGDAFSAGDDANVYFVVNEDSGDGADDGGGAEESPPPAQPAPAPDLVTTESVDPPDPADADIDFDAFIRP